MQSKPRGQALPSGNREQFSAAKETQVRKGLDLLSGGTWLDPCVSACFKGVTFYLLFKVFPTWLTLLRWTGNQSAAGLCCWRTISDMLGKCPKSFLTLLPPSTSSVSCQNITLASDSKGIEVVSRLSTADSSVWKLQAGSGSVRWRAETLHCSEPRGSWGRERTLLSHLVPNLVFHPVLLARMSEETPAQEALSAPGGTGASVSAS